MRKQLIERLILNSNDRTVQCAKTLEEVYRRLHDKKSGVKDTLQYVSKRINAMFTQKQWKTFKVLDEEVELSFSKWIIWYSTVGRAGESPLTVMQWRHDHIYRPIWDVEMKLHGYNHVRVLKCLKRKLGTCQECFDIIDYKDEPTIITKATVVIKCLLSFLEFHKALVPGLKLLAFIFDIAKDGRPLV